MFDMAKLLHTNTCACLATGTAIEVAATSALTGGAMVGMGNEAQVMCVSGREGE